MSYYNFDLVKLTLGNYLWIFEVSVTFLLVNLFTITQSKYDTIINYFCIHDNRLKYFLYCQLQINNF